MSTSTRSRSRSRRPRCCCSGAPPASRRAPIVLYTAQNLRKRYPIPFRWLERSRLRHGVRHLRLQHRGGAHRRVEGLPRARAGDPARRRRRRDSDRGEPADAAGRRRAELDRAPITVGFIGRLVPEKGIVVLLRCGRPRPRLRAAHRRRRAACRRRLRSGPRRAESSDACRVRRHDRAGDGGRVLPLGRRARRAVARHEALDRAVRPRRGRGDGVRNAGGLERRRCAARRRGRSGASSCRRAMPPRSPRRSSKPAGPRQPELRVRGLARAAECSWDAVGRDYLELYARCCTSRIEPAGAPRHRGHRRRVRRARPAARALAPIAGMPVTVVDNSSLPEIAALCAELGVRYIDSGRNIGFGAGVNVGARRPARARRRRAAAESRRADRARPGRRAAPRAALRTRSRQRRARRRWTRAGAPPTSSGRSPRRAAPGSRPSGWAALQRGPRFVIGSILMLRAEALDQVGGFDERFFLYAEETDWAFRAHLLGWRHARVAEATAMHVGAGTSRDAAARDAHFYASQERYLRKHFGALGWQSARAAQLLGSTARGLVLRGARGRRRVGGPPRSGGSGARRSGPRAGACAPAGAAPARGAGGDRGIRTARIGAGAHRADRAGHLTRQRRRRRRVEPRARVHRARRDRRALHRVDRAPPVAQAAQVVDRSPPRSGPATSSGSARSALRGPSASSPSARAL